jgi:hypothetical protein
MCLQCCFSSLFLPSMPIDESTMASASVFTYHCLCSQLVLATFAPIESYPARKLDSSYICAITGDQPPLPDGLLHPDSTIEEVQPKILRLEDGFEKRYEVHCVRCGLCIGYKLDQSQFDETKTGPDTKLFYALPGGLRSSQDVAAEVSER